MKQRTFAHRVALACGLLVAGLGCGDKPAVSTATTEATVTGTVKIHGKLLDGGEVVFDPANYVRTKEVARKALIASDGTYSIVTLVGQNTVRVVLPRKGVGPQPDAKNDNRSGNVEYQQMEVDVKAGANTVNVEFPTPEDAE
jgi:hypothetical protein